MHLENSKNLGDNLLQLNFMRKACLANRQLEIDYYCKTDYHESLAPFIDSEWSNQIRLHPWEQRPASAIDTWIAGNLLPGFYWNHPKRRIYNEFYYEWFKHLAAHMGISQVVKTHYEVALSHPVFDDLGPIQGSQFYQIYDCLVLDCDPMSGQFHFDRATWELAKTRWRQKWNIISAHDAQLTLVQIGLLARAAKTVVAICTGPLHAAFNSRALETVKQWHVFHAAHTYNYVPQIKAWRTNSEVLAINQLTERY